MSDNKFKVKNGLTIEGGTTDTSITADGSGGILVGGQPLSSNPTISNKTLRTALSLAPSNWVNTNGGSASFDNVLSMRVDQSTSPNTLKFTLNDTNLSWSTNATTGNTYIVDFNNSFTTGDQFTMSSVAGGYSFTFQVMGAAVIDQTTGEISIPINPLATNLGIYNFPIFGTISILGYVGTKNYELTLADANDHLLIDTQDPTSAVVIPWNDQTSFPVGTSIELTQVNSGQFDVVGKNKVIGPSIGTNFSQNTFGQEHRAVAYGNGLWVTVGTYGEMWKSTDATTWSQLVNPGGNDLNGLAYGNGLWVATGAYAVNYSTDGTSWTGLESPQFSRSVAFGNGLFVSVGDYASVAYSSNGVDWTQSSGVYSQIGNYRLSEVTFGNGIWMAVGDYEALAISTDAINWTASTYTAFPFDAHVKSVGYGNGKFVALSNNGDVAYSTDNGVTWSSADLNNVVTPIPSPRSVAYGNGLWLIGSYNLSMPFSTDGIYWYQDDNHIYPPETTIIDIKYDNEMWVAVGDYGNTATSPKLQGTPTINVPGDGAPNSVAKNSTLKITQTATDVWTLSGETAYHFPATHTLAGALIGHTDQITAEVSLGRDALTKVALPTYTGSQNTALGVNTLASNLTGSFNTAIGTGALNTNISGSHNSAFGISSLAFNTIGIKNTATGAYSLYNNTEGSNNSAFGYNALAVNSTGNDNSAFGYFALSSNSSSGNSAFGTNALLNNSQGSNNSAFGYNTLAVNPSGSDNSAFGYQALNSAPDAYSNSAFGSNALKNVNSNMGGYNTAVGAGAMFGDANSTVSGNANVGIGLNSMYNYTSASFNVAVGRSTLYGISTGNGNIAVGDYAGSNISTGSNNIIIGTSAVNSAGSSTGSYNTLIGASAATLTAINGNGNTGVGSGTLYSLSTGSNNTAIGQNAGYIINTGSNNIVLGYGADVTLSTVSNEATVGNSSINRFRIPGLSVDWKKNTGTPLAPQAIFFAIPYSGGASNVSYSTDGISWNYNSLGLDLSSSMAAAYGNGTYVIVGSNYAASSTDGLTWTTRTIPAGSWMGVTYGNGIFVATNGTSSNISATSTDGITWTSRTMPSTVPWKGVAYGSGVFVATTSNNATTAASSPDGITWTARTLSTSTAWSSVTYGNGLFVAVGGPSSSSASTSPDGITWTTRTLPAARDWTSVTYGNGIFVAISNTSNGAATSTDGITWTARTALSGQVVSFSNGMFVIGLSGNGTQVATSTDGITWTLRTVASASKQWYSIVGINYYAQSVNSINVPAPNQPISASSYTVATTEKFIVINSTAIHTLTLPNAGQYPGREITVKQIAAFAVNSASSNVQPLTSTTAGTAILSGAGKFARLVSNGQVWVIMEAN